MSKENFIYWKEIVGLEDTDFPQMIPLDESNIHKASIVSTRLLPIRNRISTNNLVSIQVQPGWGATTLYKKIVSDLEKDHMRLLINFDFEKNELDGSLTEEEFEFRTKWKLANGIADIMREVPMQQTYMYEVFDFEDTGSTPWIGHLRKKKKRLTECQNNAKDFYSEFKFFDKLSIVDCVNFFLANFQIQCVFMYLFPRKIAEDNLLELVGIIKNKYDGMNITPAAMREVYISTPKIFKMIKNVYTRPFYEIPYKRYSAAEMYSMLVSSYKNDDVMFSSVNDVFDEEFINRAYNERLSMVKIMEKVTKIIEDSLEGDTANIPYKLTISEKSEV
ncbi:hypothetical protein D7V82_06550 [bacterium 1xD8-6]|nr:hypothetical protein D7V72_06785 [bacterium D16-36]RKI70880.1 hypothetical protein D7V82_06550 [bacterium 1xD8-6]